MNIKKQIQSIYLYDAVISFRIVDAVWVLFLLDRGYSLVQVGIGEAVFHVTSMICEVPSGMAADLFGRKKTLALAGTAGVLSSIFMGYGDWFGFIYLGMMFSAIGISMVSGTEEAILYDSLLNVKEEESYKKRKSNLSIIGRISSTSSCLVSPVAIYLGYQKVYLLSALLNVAQILIAMCMDEPIVTERQKERQKSTFVETGKRLEQHIAETFQFMRKNPRTMCKLLADAAIACPCYLTLMYLQEHLVNCGWPKAWIGIPLFVIPLAGVAGAWMAAKTNICFLKSALICGIVGGIGTAFAGNKRLFLAVAGAMLGRMTEAFVEIVSGEAINKDLESDQRATMISVDSMLYSVLMIVASLVTGYWAEHFGMENMFRMFGISLVTATIAGCAVYTGYTKEDKNGRASG
ncbi:MAG: MFS transporter [Schaedlerella sp.]|nr:MFS transporter [Schaedlerella sp.]